MSRTSRQYFNAHQQEWLDDYRAYLDADPDYVKWADTIEDRDMNINDVFPSNYLKASDLGGRKLKLTIEKVELEKVGSDQKPVLYFVGKEKGLVLNKTNAQVIASSHSPETDGWEGKEIAIYPAKVQFQNQMVDAIRVEGVVPTADNDDVPF